MLSKIKALFLFLIALFFIVFAVANRQLVTLSFFPLPYAVEMPIFLFSMVCFTLGIMMAGLLFSARSIKSRRLYRSEHKRVMALENELAGVKAENESLPPALPNY